MTSTRTPLPWLCRLGWHRWSVWTPMHDQMAPKPGEEPCQERVCLRCNLEVTRFWDDGH